MLTGDDRHALGWVVQTQTSAPGGDTEDAQSQTFREVADVQERTPRPTPEALRATGPGRWATADGRWEIRADEVGYTCVDYQGRRSFYSTGTLDDVARYIRICR